MAKRKAANKPATAAKPRQRSMIWLQGLLCGAMVTLATPTALLLGVLLGPALLAIAAGSRARAAARAQHRPVQHGGGGRSAADAVDRRPQHGDGDRAAERSPDPGDGMERRGRRLAARRGGADRGSRGAGGAEHCARRPAACRAGRGWWRPGGWNRPRPISDPPLAGLTPGGPRRPTAIAAGARRSAPSSPSAASRRRAPRSAAPARARCRTAATAPRAWSGCPSAGARSGCAARARSAS